MTVPLIEHLKILPAKSPISRKETAIKMISKLKAELECRQDLIMKEESATFKIFSDLYRKRRIALDELILKGMEPKNLECLEQKLMKLKNEVNEQEGFLLI